MSGRTGLGPIEEAILLALAEMQLVPGRPFGRSTRVLDAIEADHRFGERYAYDVLLDLARDWVVPLVLVDGHGNVGSAEGDPAADAKYTECRLSPIGVLAAGSERRELPPLPIDLVNGSMYRGGARPPLHPRRTLDALGALLERPSVDDDELVALVGPPAFPGGCEVTGGLASLHAGRRTKLTLTARFAEHGPGELDITNLPPGSALVFSPGQWSSGGPDSPASRLGSPTGRTASPIASISNVSTREGTRLRCRLRPGVTFDEAVAHLRGVWGVAVEVEAQLPRPLPDMLREWTSAQGEPGTAAALHDLANLVGEDPQPSP